MPVKAYDVSETMEYTLKSDTQDPTVWIIGRIDHELWGHLQDRNTRMEVNNLGGDAQGTVRVNIYGRTGDLVRFGLKGWRNFLDKNGNEVPYSTVSRSTGVGNRPGLSDRTMDQLRPFLAELAGEVERFNGVTGEAAGN